VYTAEAKKLSLNLVTVTIAAQASPADASSVEGNFVFVPNGYLYPMSLGTMPVIPAIQEGFLTSGIGSVQLVASDNFAANVLTWDVIINIRGMLTINVTDVIVLFASGASQSVWDILEINGWIPVQQP
jgi:hypothetical protein